VLNLANVLINLAAFSVWLLVPFYLARATEFGLVTSGALLASGAAGAIVASPIGGRLIGIVPVRLVALAGAAMVGTGLALIGTWDSVTSPQALVTALALQGIGLGFFYVAYTDIVTASIPPQNRGVAGSLAMVTRTVGTVSAAATVLLLFQSFDAAGDFLPAFRRTFEIAALLAFAVAGVIALRSPPEMIGVLARRRGRVMIGAGLREEDG